MPSIVDSIFSFGPQKPQLPAVDCFEECICICSSAFDYLEHVLAVFLKCNMGLIQKKCQRTNSLNILILLTVYLKKWSLVIWYSSIPNQVTGTSSSVNPSIIHSSHDPTKAASEPLPKPQGNCHSLSWQCGTGQAGV